MGESAEATRFRVGIMDMVRSLPGPEGLDRALETLFAISDLVLDDRYCDQHTMTRIREVLAAAHPESSSEEEEET